jgi:hypothetical protein
MRTAPSRRACSMPCSVFPQQKPHRAFAAPGSVGPPQVPQRRHAPPVRFPGEVLVRGQLAGLLHDWVPRNGGSPAPASSPADPRPGTEQKKCTVRDAGGDGEAVAAEERHGVGKSHPPTARAAAGRNLGTWRPVESPPGSRIVLLLSLDGLVKRQGPCRTGLPGRTAGRRGTKWRSCRTFRWRHPASDTRGARGGIVTPASQPFKARTTLQSGRAKSGREPTPPG